MIQSRLAARERRNIVRCRERFGSGETQSRVL
jgi:hypothetical protein